MAYRDVQITGGNTILASIGRLNQYLALQVAEKRREDEKAKINKVGSDIANTFLKLGPNPTPNQVSMATLHATKLAGENGALQENMNTISALAQHTMAMAQYNKAQSIISDVANRLSQDTPYNVDGMDPAAALQYLDYKSKSAMSQKAVKNGRNILKVINQKDHGYKEVATIDLGPKENELAAFAAKEAIKAKYKMAIDAANSAAEGKTQKISDLKTWYNTAMTEATNAAINILNQSGLELSEKDLEKYPGGAVGYVVNMSKDITKMQNFIEKSENLPEVSAGSEIIGLKYAGAPGYVDQYGTPTGAGVAAVPFALKEDFMDFFAKLEEADRAEAQIAENLSTIPSERLNAEQKQLLYSRLEKDIRNIISNPEGDPKKYRAVEKVIRTISGNKTDSLESILEDENIKGATLNTFLGLVAKQK